MLRVSKLGFQCQFYMLENIIGLKDFELPRKHWKMVLGD